MSLPARLLRTVFRPLIRRLWGGHKAPTELKSPVIDVELTNACNTACVFCPRRKTPRQGYMDSATVAQVIQRLRDLSSPPDVQFCGLGEPLLHPGVVDCVRQFAAAGLPPAITTNGSLLTEGLSRALLDAGVRKIYFSVSGIHDQYAQIHRLDFETTRRNIAHFAAISGPNCKTVISIVRSDLNRDRIEDMKAYWRGQGVERFQVLDSNNRAGSLETEDSSLRDEELRQEARRVLERNRLDPWCEVPFLFTFIGWDGNHYVCCHDFTKRFPLGSVFEHDIAQVNSIKRELLRTGPDLCRCCSNDYLNMIGKALAQIDAHQATESLLDRTLVVVRFRQERLRRTQVEYGVEPVLPHPRASDRAA